MTLEERVTALEARLAQAEARLALLEARPLPLLPSVQFPNSNPCSGWQCSICHAWIPAGTSHSCGGSFT